MKIIKLGKKIIVFITLYIVFNTSSYATEILLDIFVPRESYFALLQYHEELKKGDNRIGKLIIKNNTMDGFNVSIKSYNESTLVPGIQSILDGATPINYKFRLERNVGDIGLGNMVTLEPDLTTGALISIIDTVEKQLSRTNISYYIYLNLEDNTNSLALSGDYVEKLDIIYTDK